MAKPRTHKINAKTLTAIGRLIRACAEMEDILAFHLASLVEVSESQLSALIGRQAVSSVRNSALHLAKLHSAGALELHRAMFNEQFTLLFKMRNVLAHGVFMGKDPEGRLAFLTAEALEPLDNAGRKVVKAYSSQDIIDGAAAAERAIPNFENKLQVQKLRRRRYELPLLGLPKGQMRGKRLTKR